MTIHNCTLIDKTIKDCSNIFSNNIDQHVTNYLSSFSNKERKQIVVSLYNNTHYRYSILKYIAKTNYLDGLLQLCYHHLIIRKILLLLSKQQIKDIEQLLFEHIIQQRSKNKTLIENYKQIKEVIDRL
jgi:hypothetical protein